MGCFVALLALISPRLGIVWLWLTGDLLSRSFDSSLLPFIGFFLLPWTTLTYAVMWSIGTDRVYGIEWFFVALAFLVDIGAFASADRGRKSRNSR
jgi:hypothetical protein